MKEVVLLCIMWICIFILHSHPALQQALQVGHKASVYVFQSPIFPCWFEGIIGTEICARFMVSLPRCDYTYLEELKEGEVGVEGVY